MKIFSVRQRVRARVESLKGQVWLNIIIWIVMKYQDFSFYWKIISSSRAVNYTVFLSFTFEDIGVAMVTNMISPL